jgi:polar amino acid transport system substrate-binding protein
MTRNKKNLFLGRSLIVSIIVFCFTCINLQANQLKEIQQKGEIVVGVKNDFDPFGFVSRKGKIIGFDIDMAKFIAKELGVKLKLVPVTSSNRIPMLLDKRIDIIMASMTHKVSRDKDIDFSISYFYDGQAILVRRESKIRSYNDFVNRKIAAVKGASSGKVFSVVQPLSQIKYYDTYEDAFKAIDAKEVDGMTSDFAFLSVKAKKSNFKYKTAGKPFTVEPYGIGIRENESDLRDEINFILQTSVKKGIYDRIYKKWFNKLPLKKPVLWP